VINDVFTMRPDGSGVVNLTGSKGFSGDAAWSPDGSRIAFDSDRGQYPVKQGIYVMNRDGSNVRRITTLPRDAANDLAPRFSPDGKRLVFTRYLGTDDFAPSAIFTVRTDGTGLRRLTSYAILAGDADWSPDGEQIVFEAYPDKRFGDVYVIDADGRHLRNLTNNAGNGGAADPVWSPDAKKILFLDARVVNGTFKNGLATMRPDGTGRQFFSEAPTVEHQPDWESIRVEDDRASDDGSADSGLGESH
jgi:TolB protein